MRKPTLQMLAGLGVWLTLALPLTAKKPGTGGGGGTSTASGLFVRVDLLDAVPTPTGNIPASIRSDGNGNCPVDPDYEYWDTGNDGPCQGQPLGPGVSSNLSNGGRWKVDDTLPRDGSQSPVPSIGGDRWLDIDFTQAGGACPAEIVAEFGGDLTNCILNAEVRMSADRAFKKRASRQPFTIQILCTHPGDPQGNPLSSDCTGRPEYLVQWDFPLFIESDPNFPGKNRVLLSSSDEATAATLTRESGETVAQELELPIGIRLRRQFCTSTGICTEP